MQPHSTLHQFAVLALLLLLLPSPTRAERRTALVMGNAAYEMGLLRNPVHDASDMATALRQLGFEVTLLRDAARRPMVEAIDLFSRHLRQGGVGVFYFAGHGVQVGGENYLIPVDTRIGREQDVPYEAVPVGRILGGMEDADNQLNILILDACRDNPFARQWRSSQRGLAVIQAVRGSLIAYATAPGAVASDGDGRNGLYTAHVLQHLTTPGLSVEHFFKKVREGVVKATKGKQTPWESSSLIGDFFFAPQATSNAEAVMWGLVEHSSNPEDIATFLKAYPDGQFAPAARQKLQQLQQLAAQQRREEQNRLAEQERQRREREEAEAQRREEERQRLEAQQKLAAQQQLEAERQRVEAQQRAEAQQREEEQKRFKDAQRQEGQTPQIGQNLLTQQLPQVARLEPESSLRRRASVAVPAATISFISSSGGPIQIAAFQLDRYPVSNSEFLAFVRAYPQWQKSHIAKDLHDGDYLKHWGGDEIIKPNEMELPIRYISYHAALAYCQAIGETLPGIGHFRAAAMHETYERFLSITYEKPYKPSEFNFVSEEWTRGPFRDDLNPEKVVVFSFRRQHNSKDSLTDKRHTGRSLSFRCGYQEP